MDAPGQTDLNRIPLQETLRSGARDPEDYRASPRDRLFFDTAVRSGLMEIDVGTLARQRSGNKLIQQLADKMTQDQTQLIAMLTKNAETMHVGVAQNAGKRSAAECRKLGTLTGVEFDKEFLLFAQTESKQELDTYQAVLARKTSRNLRLTVETGVQLISFHLAVAQKLASL